MHERTVRMFEAAWFAAGENRGDSGETNWLGGSDAAALRIIAMAQVATAIHMAEQARWAADRSPAQRINRSVEPPALSSDASEVMR